MKKTKLLLIFLFLFSFIFFRGNTRLVFAQIGENIPFQVATAGASSVTSNSAVLQASVSTEYIGSFSRPSVWIEYGTTSSFGYVTSPQEFTSRTPVIRTRVIGLLPGTKYYFRAVAQGASGQKKGEILEFYTLNADGSQFVVNNTTTTNNTNTTNNNTNSNTSGGTDSTNNNINPAGFGGSFSSSLFLDIDDGFETYTEEDILTYSVFAKNVQKEDLENVYISIEIPKEMSYLGDNARGIFRPETNELIFSIGNLDEDSSFSSKIDLRPSLVPVNGQQIIIKATAFYTDAVQKMQFQTVDFDANTFQLEGNLRLATENTSVSVEEQAEKRSVLAIILIALIVVLLFIIVILLARKLYLRYKKEKDVKSLGGTDLFNSPNTGFSAGNNYNNQHNNGLNHNIHNQGQTNHPSNSFTFHPGQQNHNNQASNNSHSHHSTHNIHKNEETKSVFDGVDNEVKSVTDQKRDAIEEARKMFEKRAEDLSNSIDSKDSSIPPNLPL